jgi:cyanate permease
MIQSIGQLGSWLGPWGFGLVKDASGSNNIALLCLAAAPALSAVLVVLVGHDRRLDGSPRPDGKADRRSESHEVTEGRT